MRKLENELGATLVNRDGRGLTLTEEGQRLALSLGDAFDRIEEAVDSFKRRGRTELRISTVSTFATRWLIPRLPDFQASQQDVELLLSASTRMIDLDRENYDCAIRLGTGNWPSVESHLLWKEHLAVALAPALLQNRDADDPENLKSLRLLHSASRRGDWSALARGSRSRSSRYQVGHGAAKPRSRDPGGNCRHGRHRDRSPVRVPGTGGRAPDHAELEGGRARHRILVRALAGTNADAPRRRVQRLVADGGLERFSANRLALQPSLTS